MTMKIVVFLSLFSSAVALSTGAADCRSGDHAASGHSGDPGTFADGTFQLLLGNRELETDVTITMEKGTTFAFDVAAQDGTPIKGYSIIISGNGELTEDAGQFNSFCTDPLVGVTHTDSSEKSSVSTSFTPTESGSITMDITIFVNNPNPSTFYYQQYSFNVIDDLNEFDKPTYPPKLNPTAMPTLSPASVPTTTNIPPSGNPPSDSPPTDGMGSAGAGLQFVGALFLGAIIAVSI